LCGCNWLDERGHKSLPLTGNADLHLRVDGKPVDAIQRDERQYVFSLGAKPRHVRLRSRSAEPQALGLERDNRSLRVAVRRLILAQAWVKDAALGDGFHPCEAVYDLRWTNGDAAVPDMLFSTMSGAAMLRVKLARGFQYVDDAAAGEAPPALSPKRVWDPFGTGGSTP